MGKLHKIRRAILRDPAKWWKDNGRGGRTVWGADHWGGWKPTGWGFNTPYQAFVKSVLDSFYDRVGNADGGPGDTA